MDGFDEIRLCAPGPGKCRVCAGVHDPGQPHDRDSFFYKHWFYRRHRRFPSWADAMAHCDDAVKAEAAAKLRRRGIAIESGGSGGDGLDQHQ